MASPAVIGLIVFWLGPVGAAVVLSFTQWNIAGAASWVGLSNLQQLIQDPLFWTALRNTAIYTGLAVPIQMSLSLPIAIALNQKLRLRGLFRALFFLPAVCSSVAVSLVWRVILDDQLGFLNWVLGWFGIPHVPWLLTPATAMASVVMVSVWQGIGYPIILWLAGLQSIPSGYYEAAVIDGAGPLARLRHVTLPLLSPTTFFILVISIISSFQVFDQTYVLTSGGPDESTTTVVLLIYQQAFQRFSLGYASALGVVLFLVILGVSLVQFWLQRRWVNYDL